MSDDIVRGRLTVPVAPGNRGAAGELATLFRQRGCAAVGGQGMRVILPLPTEAGSVVPADLSLLAIDAAL